ncbi:MAG: ribonuclease HII [Gammaproteobacteria bacterium]|nr:ribonuclease HII [Gammaproteobacteria bacterium]
MTARRKPVMRRHGLVAGIDEVGRGPLAGPVVTAAVILANPGGLEGLDDSKKLTEKKRNRLAGEIRQHSLAWAIAWADAAEIDCLNILQATMLAMRRAILGLPVLPALVRIDGNRLPNLCVSGHHVRGEAVVGGDGKIAAISAASIIAKVARDAMMRRMDKQFPGYGFAQHKGYGTAEHLRNIDRLGPCQQHRRSFSPLRMGTDG